MGGRCPPSLLSKAKQSESGTTTSPQLKGARVIPHYELFVLLGRVHLDQPKIVIHTQPGNSPGRIACVAFGDVFAVLRRWSSQPPLQSGELSVTFQRVCQTRWCVVAKPFGSFLLRE